MRQRTRSGAQDRSEPRRVVIVGGGFAGLFAARAFRRRRVQVTLVDRAAHHLFQPLLYQCATGMLSEGQVAMPLRAILRKHANVDCVLAEVTGFDVAGPHRPRAAADRRRDRVPVRRPDPGRRRAAVVLRA